jgi:hypothetical protein
MMRKVMRDILLVIGNDHNPPISWLGCKIVNLLKTLFSAGSSTIVSNGLPVYLGWAEFYSQQEQKTVTVTNPVYRVLSSNNCTVIMKKL